MEETMKVLTTAVVLAGAALMIQPAAARVCIATRDITGTHSDDGKTLVFNLRDGTSRVNHLQGICSDLKWNGFAWTIRGPEEVCEGQQSLRTLQSGQVCVLGKFDPPVSREKHVQN
jgi:hypothetical protein